MGCKALARLTPRMGVEPHLWGVTGSTPTLTDPHERGRASRAESKLDVWVARLCKGLEQDELEHAGVQPCAGRGAGEHPEGEAVGGVDPSQTASLQGRAGQLSPGSGW